MLNIYTVFALTKLFDRIKEKKLKYPIIIQIRNVL